MGAMHWQSGQGIVSEPGETALFSNQAMQVDNNQINGQLQFEVTVGMANVAKSVGSALPTQVREQTTRNLVRGQIIRDVR